MSGGRSLALAAAGACAGQAAYHGSVRALVRWVVRRVNAGDPSAMLRLYADDVRFVFPGEHSWGGERRGRAEVEEFLRRFVRVGIQGAVEDVIVQGPPWRTTAAVLFNDHARAPDGRLVYENRAVIVLRVRWGRIVHEETYEDTQKVERFDEWLADHEPAAV